MDIETTAPAAGLGHNAPPLAERLALDYAALIDRANDLRVGALKVPDAVTDEATAREVTDFAAQVRLHARAVEDAREAEKKPHLEAGRTVDTFFKSVGEALDKVMKDLTKRVDTYRRAKEAEERARKAAELAALAEEQRRANEAAAKAQAEAEALAKAGQRDAAAKALVAAENAAIEAKAAEQATAATERREVGTVRGDRGSAAHGRTVWRFEVTDPTAIPRHLLMLDEQAVRDAMREAGSAALADGSFAIAGIRFYPETSTVIRG